MQQIDAMREIRLRKIRIGQAHPRPHVPEEMQAYRHGQMQRWAAVGFVFSWVLLVTAWGVALSPKSPPGTNVVAGNAIADMGR